MVIGGPETWSVVYQDLRDDIAGATFPNGEDTLEIFIKCDYLGPLYTNLESLVIRPKGWVVVM